MKKPVQFTIQTESSSSRGVFYTTIKYVDGSTSCNCPGWTRRVAEDGSRSCKHIDRVAKMQISADAAMKRMAAAASAAATKVRTMRDAFEAIAEKPKPAAPRPRPADAPRRRYFAEDE